MSASAKLVVGWTLDQIFEVKQVDGKKKFDQNTGKPVFNPVDALFLRGKFLAIPEENYPGEWGGLIPGVKIFGTGDSEGGYHNGTRPYDLSKFVAGVKVADADEEVNGGGTIKRVENTYVTAMKKLQEAISTATEAIGGVYNKLGLIDPPPPNVYVVLYNSY